MDERVQAMRAIWTQDEAQYHGRYVDFGPIWSWPKPKQRPQPPILVGGAGKGVISRFLAYGDEWMPHAGMPAKQLGVALGVLADHADRCIVKGHGGKTPEENSEELMASVARLMRSG
jgi:alkanesulfonate monooxygenase SsuD/methylene tetrahydromethanopterin reductase-like flavin-dependent oxidoreductase (luciferase family)